MHLLLIEPVLARQHRGFVYHIILLALDIVQPIEETNWLENYINDATNV